MPKLAINRFRYGAAALMVVIGLIVSSSFQPIQASQRICEHCAAPAPPLPTIFRAGPDLDGLQVHVVGPRFDAIEVFFKDLFYRSTIPDACNLQCNDSVLLAPVSKYGLFAIRTGSHFDTVYVYGWLTDKDSSMSTTGPIVLEPGRPVSMMWVTSKILKINYGPGGCKEFVLQFRGGDNPWRTLYSDQQPPLAAQPSRTVR